MKSIFLLVFFLMQILPAFAQKNKDKKPNIILIMADDLGYSDLGCYGGEINTPNLDSLAFNGIRFTQFYNCAKCAPTRASLLTGLYPQQVGEHGSPAQEQWPNSITLPEIMKNQGYETFMVGKWHGNEKDTLTPLNNGFDRFYGFTYKKDSYFDSDNLRIDKHPFSITQKNKDFYLTDSFVDYSIEFMRQRKDKRNPFFLYIAFKAPHFPLQAPKEDIAKYEDFYLKGWDQIRQLRICYEIN